jgi:predicted DNA-binding transcriptional regulator YafY
MLEPIGLCHYGQAWHLIGWCKLRNNYRDFRVSRIQHLEILDKTFEPDAHPSLQEYLDSMIRSSELQEVVVRFDKATARHLGNQKYYYGYVREEVKDDYVYMCYVTSHLEYFGRWLLMYTHHVNIESPEALVTVMKELTEEVRQHYLPVEH